MSGPIPDRRAGRMPRGLLGMLVLVAVVELIIAGRRLDFTSIWADTWRLSAEAAGTGLKDRDVLIFGDSLVKFGVLPKRIEALAGLRSYNLAIGAGTTATNYFLLRRALDSGAKPKAIVADFYPMMYPENTHDRASAYADLATARDCVDLGWTARDPNLTAKTLLSKALTSYKQRYEIRDSIRLAFQGLRASPWPAQAAIWQTWRMHGGAQPTPFSPWGCAYDPNLVNALMFQNWSCPPFQEAYIDKFLALAASRDIPVYWLIPPMSPRIYAHRRPVGTDEAYDRLVRPFLKRYPNLTVLDARGSGYDDSVHIDLVHLEYRGAKVLSADLGTFLAGRIRGQNRDRIVARVEADRWIALPPLAGRSGEELLRNIATSSGATVR